jgi:hypothetical protein
MKKGRRRNVEQHRAAVEAQDVSVGVIEDHSPLPQ